MYKNKIILKKLKYQKNRKADEFEPELEEEASELDDIGNTLVTCVENHIYFYDSVNTKSILLLIRYIKNLNIKLALSKATLNARYQIMADFKIYLHINSVGGYITDAFAAVDHIRLSEFPIYSIVEGSAASAATFLSMVCNKRQITENSSMLIHQLRSSFEGTYEQLDDDHINNKFLQEKIITLYIKYSNGKLSRKILDKILKHDLMWDANKCLAHGLVDEIL